jgi:hippurate hydrolase
MDALPITEDTDLEFSSITPGVMHACGHDLHMSILVGALQQLHEARDQLAGDVVFMFQPGEEGFDGASVMIDEGVLEATGHQVDAAFALHVFSAGPPLGQIGVRRGAMLSAADALKVTVTGQGGHGSAPRLARDPIPATAEMITAIQTLVTRRLDVFDPVVISVGTVHAGTQRNIIPESASFEATVRTYSRAAQQQVEAELRRLLTGIATGHGVCAQVEYVHEYPPTINDADEADFALATARRLFGDDRCTELERPFTASEDFSRVLDRVPGAFLSLGAQVPTEQGGHGAFNHSAKAMFHESALADGADLLAGLARRKLTTDPEHT